MIPLFAGYAMVFWYLAARWRRRWPAVLAVLGAAAGLVVLNAGHWYLNLLSDGRIYLPVLRAVMYPYTLLVVGVAAYIALLPRRLRRAAGECGGCGYSLDGLDPDLPGTLCPECGVVYEPPVSVWGGADPAIRRRQLTAWSSADFTHGADATGRPLPAPQAAAPR